MRGGALVDMLPRKLPDGTEAFLPVPGGAFFITAAALGTLDKSSLKQIDSETLRSALEFGALVASRTCGQAGATPPWKQDL
jgi:hypothetical protein